MEPVTIGFITLLASAFSFIGEKILEKAVDTIFDIPAEELKNGFIRITISSRLRMHYILRS